MADYPISIDAVRNMLLRLKHCHSPEYIDLGISMALHKLEGFPPMDVATVVHGRWEDVTEIIAGIRHPQTRCTACGKVYWGYRTECYYCPNCGAKMDLVEDTDAGNTM